MAFGNAIKKSNIAENWLFQFGYYNGDSDGNGDGGFSAVTQSNGNANLINDASNINDSQTDIDVDDGTVFIAGDHIKVDSEIMRVVSISTNELTVERAAMSTTAATHNDNTQVYWQNFFPISFSDTTYNSVFYFGTVLNRPSIRESINLANSTAKTSNVSVSIPDFKYEGANVSQELYGGRNKYINQEVKVLSQIDGDAPNQIGSFRLVDISTIGNQITLSLASHRPWDYISIPQNKTTGTNRLFPIAYGAYDSSTASTISSADFCTNNSLFPVPIDKFGSGSCISLHPHSGTVDDAKVFYYEKNLDKFIPIYTTSYFMDTVAYDGGYASKVPSSLKRAIKFRPDAFDVDNEWTDADNAFDGSTSTNDFATDTSGEDVIAVDSGDETLEDTKNLILNLPQLDGRCNTFKQRVYGLVTLTVSGSGSILGSSTVKLKDQTYSRNAAIFTQTGAGSTSATYSSVIDAYTESNNLPEQLKFELVSHVTSTSTNASTVEGIGKVWDVECQAEMQVDPNADKKSFKIDNLYSGADGLTESWSGSNGAITEVHQAHRDLLIRFGDMTTATPTGWSDLDTARDGWDIRWWSLKEVDLKKVLDKMAYEACFIFRFKSDGTPQYIHIPNSPSTDHTLSKDDIADITLKVTPFSELITKRTINYKKHPAESRYLSTVTTEDTTNNPRKKWGLKTKENIEDIKLDMLVANVGDANPGNDDPNDSFAGYYNNIFGDVKLVVSCSILNPFYYSLEVGDIVEFDENNMFPETPMGHNSATWNNLKMMVVSTNRSPGNLSITAREV